MDEATYAPAKKRGFLSLAFHPLDEGITRALGLVPQSDDVATVQAGAALEHIKRFHANPDLHDVYVFAGWYAEGLKELTGTEFDPAHFANFFAAAYIMINPDHIKETT